MLTQADFLRVIEAVDQIEDPEVPVTLRDLGVLRSVTLTDAGIAVVLRATKIGCPGKSRMTEDVVKACATVNPGAQVDVVWDPAPWDPADVTPTGRVVLGEFGIVLRDHRDVSCPYCASHAVEMLSDYGGSICKVPYRCGSCGSMFERLRSIDGVQPVSINKKIR